MFIRAKGWDTWGDTRRRDFGSDSEVTPDIRCDSHRVTSELHSKSHLNHLRVRSETLLSHYRVYAEAQDSLSPNADVISEVTQK